MWWRPLIAAVLVALLAGGGAVATGQVGQSWTPGATTEPEPVPVVGDPPAVAVAVPGRSGLTTTLELRSPGDWRLLSRLGRFGESFTDNGLALAPDGQTAYFTLIPRSRRVRDLLIERATVGRGRPQQVADGEQPAVSPDGNRLAYLMGGARRPAVAVRDLSGPAAVRAVDVGRLLGRRANLFNSTTSVWLGDNEVATLAGPIAIAARSPSVARSASAASGGSPARTTAAASGGSPARTTSGARPRPRRPGAILLLVTAPPTGPLTARAITLPGVDSDAVLGADTAAPGSLLVAWLGPHDVTIIARVDPDAPVPLPHHVLSIPAAQVLCFDPAGRRVLYVQGHRPPALYIARLAGNRLVDRHRLQRSYADGAVAW